MTSLANIEWILEDLTKIKSIMKDQLQIKIIITREAVCGSEFISKLTDSTTKETYTTDLSLELSTSICQRSSEDTAENTVALFVNEHSGTPISVLASGPGTMGEDVGKTVNGLRKRVHADIAYHIETFAA